MLLEQIYLFLSHIFAIVLYNPYIRIILICNRNSNTLYETSSSHSSMHHNGRNSNKHFCPRKIMVDKNGGK